MDDLRARIGGEVIGPADAGYDPCRAVFDERVDRRPAAIVRCRSRDDVAAALAYAGERGLPVAVRCGGTTAEATIDGGIVIDVSPMKAVAVDREARTARVGAGLTWAELDAATQEHGLAVTGARVSGLGVAGVALGAGSGWLERPLGPTGDSVIGTEAVDGVVTELELHLHPVGPMLACGFLSYPRERAREVAGAYRDYVEAAPEEVGGGLVLFAGRGGACTIAFCCLGTVDEGERAVAPLRALGPSLDAVGANEYRAFQAMTDLHHPSGARAELRGGLLDELSDAALDAAAAAADAPASALSQLLLQPRRGEPRWRYQCLGIWPPRASLDRGNVAWVADVAAALAPFSVPG
jgi:FAD binding domain